MTKSVSKNVVVMCVVGARPNFMKIAPIIRELNKEDNIFTPVLIHTGQHYDKSMKGEIFDQLGIPEPDVDLGIGSGSHAEQTGMIMIKFDAELTEKKPAIVLVVGDVNSTIACSLTAVKRNIPVVHVEAGLRSYDRAMPEEINRILTDQISDILFTTEKDAVNNLESEGINKNNVYFVGNVMIDTLLNSISKIDSIDNILQKYIDKNIDRVSENNYGILTLHRPSNVDNEDILKSLLNAVKEISSNLPIIFPIHPRTKLKLIEFGLNELLENSKNIIILPPIGYLDLLGLMKSSKLVLTDSGGIQEETTALGVPCITLRENTERPVTVTDGTNTIVGTDTEKLMHCFNDILLHGGKAGQIPEKWDGHAAERIIDELQKWYLRDNVE